MTDEQIEKALECCTRKSCGECNYVATPFCFNEVKRDALALLKQLREEIETLRAKTDDFPFCALSGCEAVSDTCYKAGPHSIFNKIRTEAIREFADRLETETYSMENDDTIRFSLQRHPAFLAALMIVRRKIEALSQEMTEEQK